MSAVVEGDLYWVWYAFSDDPQAGKVRPALVYDVQDDGMITFVLLKITTKLHNGRYDEFKVPILKWREAGLPDVSYVQTLGGIVVDYDSFLGLKKEYIGHLYLSDLRNVRKMRHLARQ